MSMHISVSKSLLLAMCAVMVVFGVYEVFEWVFLRGANRHLLHILHLVRGLVTAILAASVAIWCLLRGSPSLLAVGGLTQPVLPGKRLSNEQRVVNYCQWFIGMRWVAMIVAVTLIVIVVKITGLLPDNVWWPLLALTAALAVVNLIYEAMLRGGRTGCLLSLQVYVDLIILTALLHFSGGIENPCSTLMLFHVIIGGIVLSRRQCYEVAAMATVLFIVMAIAEWAHWFNHYALLIFPHPHNSEGVMHAAHQPYYVAARIMLQTAVLFLSAYFTTTLAERLRYDERQLETLADQAIGERLLLEQSLETTRTGMRVVDAGLTTQWANAQWKQWFAPSRGGDQFVPDELIGAESAAQKTLRDGQVRVTEIELVSRETSGDEAAGDHAAPRVFQITAAPLRKSETGDVFEVVELAQEITHQKESQAKMLRAGQLAAVGELAGQVAHEVNNPIAIISAKTRLLLSDCRQEMSETIARELDKIVVLADRVARIAQGLLSSCRPSGAVCTSLDIRTPIQKVLATIEERCAKSNCVVALRIAENMPLVRGNSSELEQVFLNLFLNAIDAMPHGGTLTVQVDHADVQMRDGRPCVAVTVADTGAGMAPAVEKRIFEPFFTTKAEGKGTGLGLSICLGLVQSHGGEIDVASEVGEGTRFTLRFPVEDKAGGESDMNG